MLERALEIFDHPSPGLVFPAWRDAQMFPRMVLRVSHRLRPLAEPRPRGSLVDLLGPGDAAAPLRRFYADHDGAAICVVAGWMPPPERDWPCPTPLLTLLPLAGLEEVTTRLRRGGEKHWVIDGRESCRALVEAPRSWVVFGLAEDSADSNAYLIAMIDGPDAGAVLWIAPQLKRRPAKSIDRFFERVGGDLGALLRSCDLRARLCGPDGAPYGRDVEAYLPDVGGHPDLLESGHWASGRIDRERPGGC